MKTAVRAYEPADAEAWDEFCAGAPGAGFFHRRQWRDVVSRAYGHRPRCLLAERDGRVVGVLPLTELRSVLFGRSLCSSAFCVSAGMVTRDVEARAALAGEAGRLAEKLGVDALELRGGEAPPGDWPEKSLYVNFSRALSDDHEENLKAIPRKQRAMVRKGLAKELRSETDDDVDRFFRVYSESVRNLGTPVFSKRLFREIATGFPEALRTMFVVHGGRDVAAVMSFVHEGTVMPYYGGGTGASRGLHASDFMYWQLMRQAVEEGLTRFDFGRSKLGTGSFSFKKNWGFEAEPLPYRYYLVRAKEMPQLNPTNPKYRIMIDAWKRLPLPVANVLGPIVSRTLG